MNEKDVVDILGEPDEVRTDGRRMTSTAWLCGKCKYLHVFDSPVVTPSPCKCGSVFFEKSSRVQH